MKQGQHLNLKWSIADIDQVKAWAREGIRARQISERLEGTRLASSPQEIIALCHEAGIFIQTGKARA